MKTIQPYLIAIIFLVSQMVSAQSKSDKMYDAFENKDGVTSFGFSKNMVDAVNFDVGDEEDEQKVTGDLHRVRFMTYNPKKGDLTGSAFTKKAIGYLPKTAYKKYDDDDADNNTEIWLLGRKKKFQECHVFVKNEQEDQIRLVVSFYGDFKVDDLEGLKKAGKTFSESEE